MLFPGWILSGRIGPHVVALEAVLAIGVFLALPRRRWTAFAAGLTALGAGTVSLLALGDTAARMSLARPLNLYLDVRLVRSIGDLLSGTLGDGWGGWVLGGVGVSWIVIVFVAGRALFGLSGRGRSSRAARVGVAMVILATAAIPLRWLHPSGVALGLTGVRVVREQSQHLARMLSERERFAVEMAAAERAGPDETATLAGLGDRDVVLAFIESYGMAAVEDPRYAPVITPRLEAMGERLAARGLHIVTGKLVAPSQGGMSWLGHGSLLSGLWLENQLRYDLLLASDHATLVDDFERAGYRTVALMPAITLAWPEGARFGYETIFAHADIDYAGPPLNWVTMPDQFTWSFLEGTIRRESERPLFAELGLISSHAPWTPILEVLDDWDSIGDGEVFDRWADAGDEPEELWKDADRVREHYAMSVGYALDAMASYAHRYVDDGVIVIALGDHQPAPLITGDDASRAVPVHIIAADPSLLTPFVEWGFVEGAIPDPDGPEPRMDAFRGWFLSAFAGTSGPTEP